MVAPDGGARGWERHEGGVGTNRLRPFSVLPGAPGSDAAVSTVLELEQTNGRAGHVRFTPNAEVTDSRPLSLYRLLPPRSRPH